MYNCKTSIIPDGDATLVGTLSAEETAPDYEVVYQVMLRRTPVAEVQVLKNLEEGRKSRVKG